MSRAVVGFQPPAPALRGLITAYYWVDNPAGGAPIGDLLHPEWANLRLVSRGDWGLASGFVGPGSGARWTPAPPQALFGPTSRAGMIRAPCGGRGVGVGLLPLGWAVLTGLEASAWADRVEPVEALRATPLIPLIEALDLDGPSLGAAFDRYFLGLLERPGAQEELARAALVMRAHKALMDPEVGTVEAFAEALGVSARQAARLSLRAFGFAPKLLLRRQRFLRTLAVLRLNLDRPWASLLDERYYDQPHFVRDFRRFMGMAPSRYFALPRAMLEPAAAARQAMLGQPLQGLHAAQTAS